jgi:hypothetical protein
MPDADLVPYDQSETWAAHDATFARGVRLWTHGVIPSLSTSSLAIARQLAGVIVAHVEALTAAGRLAPDETVHLMEVGGGLGTFAANFHHALDENLGDAGRRVAARLRYLFTDYVPGTLAEAGAGEDLSPLIAAGRLLPMVYDLRTPARLEAPRLLGVIANYVACVTGVKHFQKRADEGWMELCVRRADLQLVWAPVDPRVSMRNPHHVAALERVVGDEPAMTVSVPTVFLDFLETILPRLHADGLVVVTDYGKLAPAQLRGLRDTKPVLYGESRNHDVHFPVIDAWTALAGAQLVRTSDPLLSVHTELISPAPLPALTTDSFAQGFVDRHEGQELLDLVAAARVFLEQKDYVRAIRFFARSAALDPRNAELKLKLGVANLEAGRYVEALEALTAGAAFDHWRAHDFAFEMARAYSKIGQYPHAIHAYQLSIAREPHPTTYANLGTIHETLGHERAAYRCYKQALALDPNDVIAGRRMALMKEAWWERKMREMEEPG